MTDRFRNISFGSSGIRGPAGDEITPELALALGRSAGQLADTVVVARDARTTSPMLEHALVAGLTSAGTDVTRIGIAPTPTVGYAARGFELGVMITASHNAAPDNGFKVFAPDGAAIDQLERDRLIDGLADPPERSAWDETGQARTETSLVDQHIEALLDESGPLEARPRVVVDAGNGAAAELTPRLLRQAGARPLTLNASFDGTFPGRPSEPTPENLEDLARITAATDAICGLAHDGDGDRIRAVDEDGRVLTGDQALVLLARRLRAEKIAVPVDTSRLVWDALPEAEIEVTEVGDAFISETLADGQGDFGGEPSGAMIFPEISLCPDGPHAALLLAALASRHGGLAGLVDELPTYETVRESLPCSEPAKQPAMARIQKELSTFGETTVLDGVRLETDDGWALVRPSGTEAKLRLTVEAKTSAEADRILSMVRGIVDETLHEVDSHA